MDFTQYLVTVRNRAAKLSRDQQIQHAQLGMISEVGEIANLYKHCLAYGRDFDAVNLLEEVGDVVWYFALFCDEKEISMRKLDSWAAEAVKAFAESKDADAEHSDASLVTVLNAGLSLVCAQDHLGIKEAELLEGLQASMLLLVALLQRHSFTMRQCLVVNDAKLTARNKGETFNLQGTLERDLANERAILEAGARNGEAQ
jgi:NTP pyrophosphatase (non-canonical NTP hydrolase)